jgi:hypothetical protein
MQKKYIFLVTDIMQNSTSLTIFDKLNYVASSLTHRQLTTTVK